MTLLDEDGHEFDRWHLLFVLDCLYVPDIRSALVRLGYEKERIVTWLALGMRAHQGVPARPPSLEEPKGYEGREKEPLPAEGPNSLDEMLYALTRNKDVRRLIAKHLERGRGLAHGQVLAQMTRWKEDYEARVNAPPVSPIMQV